jgi:hypothetical protein
MRFPRKGDCIQVGDAFLQLEKVVSLGKDTWMVIWGEDWRFMVLRGKERGRPRGSFAQNYERDWYRGREKVPWKFV